MPNNSDAKDILSKATFELFDAYDNAKGPKKAKIMQLIHNLNREYYKLLGLDPHLETASYSALTQEFKNSAKLVKQIRTDAEKMISDANTLAALLGTLAQVASLLA
jgi:hypothetical protein